jgi:hypothetical protein
VGQPDRASDVVVLRNRLGYRASWLALALLYAPAGWLGTAESAWATRVAATVGRPLVALVGLLAVAMLLDAYYRRVTVSADGIESRSLWSGRRTVPLASIVVVDYSRGDCMIVDDRDRCIRLQWPLAGIPELVMLLSERLPGRVLVGAAESTRRPARPRREFKAARSCKALLIRRSVSTAAESPAPQAESTPAKVPGRDSRAAGSGKYLLANGLLDVSREIRAGHFT